jgi:P27 family predicted phage terminase small subunit
MLQRGRKPAAARAIAEQFPRPWEDENDVMDKTTTGPPPPEHLSPAMKEWWAEVTAKHRLEAHREKLLQAACEAWDLMSRARECVAQHGLTFPGKDGEPRPRPEVAQARDARIAFVRIVKELDLDPPPKRDPGGYGWVPEHLR